MADLKLVDRLKNQQVSLPVGWDNIVLSHCKSAEMEEFGHGIVLYTKEAIRITDEMQSPFTALAVVTTLMATIGVLVQASEPPEQVVLAISLCRELLPLLIINPITANEAATLLDNTYSDFLFKFDKKRKMRIPKKAEEFQRMNAQAYYDYLRFAFYAETGTKEVDSTKLDESEGYRTNQLNPGKFARDILGSYATDLGNDQLINLGITLKEHIRDSSREFFDDEISTSLRFNQIILRQLLFGLPEEFKSRALATTIGFLPLLEPNAQAIRSPSGEPLVILDQGIYASLWHFAETRATLPVIARQEGDIAFAKFLIWRCYQQVMYFGNPGSPWLQKPTRNRQDISLQIKLVGLTEAMERFVVAHELAHIYAGHLVTTKHIQLNSKQTISAEDVEFFQKSQEQEYEADRLAYSWYLKSLNNPEIISSLDLFDDDLAKVAPLYIFVLFHLVEINSYEEHKQQSTHPPAELRMKRLINHYKDTFSESEFQKCVETLGYIGIMPKFSKEKLDDPSLLRRELGFRQVKAD